jgi:cellobiose phosphorylase
LTGKAILAWFVERKMQIATNLERKNMGKYGHFSEDGLEYIITRPDTPQPWLNYSINGKYHALITNTGGGFSYYISPLNGRILRRRYNSLPEDRPGRYLYIRDNKTGKYYSPTWQPTLTELEAYECRHGRGYTTLSSRYKGLRHSVTYFVPKDADMEIWRYTIENTGADRDLSLFPYVEFVPGNAMDDLIEQPNDSHFKEAHFNDKCNALIAGNKMGISYLPEEEMDKDEGCWGKVVFMTSTLPVAGWDGNRECFIGSVYRSEEDPKTVSQGKLTNSDVQSGHICGALQHNLVLKAGEKIEFCIYIGVADRLDNAYEKQVPALTKEWYSLERVDRAFGELRSYYDGLHSVVTVDTPEEKVNRHINVWNKVQLETTFRCSRDASRYHLGLSYGLGFRDQAQDLLGFIMFDPAASKALIKELFSHMFANGYVYHHFFRAQKEGHVFTNHSDDPLWMAIALAYYVRETADYSVLSDVVPYRSTNEVPTKKVKGIVHCANGFNDSVVPFWNSIPAYVKNAGKGTVLEHLFVGLDKVWKCRSKRNIPLMLGGDWNDDLNECGTKGKGESIMVAQQLAVAINYVVEMFEYAPKNAAIKKYAGKIVEYKKVFAALKKALNDNCWDGAWYHRFTRDDGRVQGSKRNKEGSIFINAQSWAVIGKLSDEKRSARCLDSVLEKLDTKYGPMLCGPHYTMADSTIGGATREAAGKKENASIFNHPVTWFIQANTIIGRGNIAYDQYYKTLPEVLSEDQDRFVVEPYVYPEYTTGPAHKEFGRAGHSWLTGTAPWMFFTGVEFILGITPWYDGLIINPCIPDAWSGYTATRKFRNATYRISVKNPGHIEYGVKEIKVDGNTISGNKVRSFGDGREHTVEVLMG